MRDLAAALGYLDDPESDEDDLDTEDDADEGDDAAGAADADGDDGTDDVDVVLVSDAERVRDAIRGDDPAELARALRDFIRSMG